LNTPFDLYSPVGNIEAVLLFFFVEKRILFKDGFWRDGFVEVDVAKSLIEGVRVETLECYNSNGKGSRRARIMCISPKMRRIRTQR